MRSVSWATLFYAIGVSNARRISLLLRHLQCCSLVTPMPAQHTHTHTRTSSTIPQINVNRATSNFSGYTCGGIYTCILYKVQIHAGYAETSKQPSLPQAHIYIYYFSVLMLLSCVMHSIICGCLFVCLRAGL